MLSTLELIDEWTEEATLAAVEREDEMEEAEDEADESWA